MSRAEAVFLLGQIPDQSSGADGVRIHGAEHLTREGLIAALQAGGRLVFFEYCISLVLLTLRSPSGIYLLQPDETGLMKGLPFTLVTALLGWWGLPMGIVYTPLVLFTNLSGGCDVTEELWPLIVADVPPAPSAEAGQAAESIQPAE
jgi:hypothetical protein